MWRGSKPIDPKFGTETQIRIKNEVKILIESAKIMPQEPLNDCLKRVFLFYKDHYLQNQSELEEGEKELTKDADRENV